METTKKDNKKRKLTYKRKVMMLLLLFMAVAVSLFSWYCYRTFSTQQKKKNLENTMQTAKSMQTSVDDRLASLKRYYIANVNNDEIKYVLENQISYSDYSKIKAAMDTFSTNHVLSDYIAGYTFVNFKTGWVISNKGMYRQEEALNMNQVEALYQASVEKVDKNYWYYNHEDEAVPMRNPNYRLTAETSGLNLILELPTPAASVYSIFIANINEEELHSWIHTNLLETEEVAVFNNKGECVYSSDDLFATACEEVQKQRMTNLTDASLTIQNQDTLQDAEGREYLLANATSNVLDWTYYVGTDWKEVSGDFNMYSDVMLLLIIAFLMIFVVVIDYAIYTPIHTLKKKVSQTRKANEGEEDNDDLLYVSKHLDSLEEDKALLEETVTAQQSKVKELFSLKLVRGEIRPEDVSGYLERYHIAMNHHYVVLSVILRITDEDTILTKADEERIGRQIALEMPDSLKSQLVMAPVYYERSISCLMTGDSEEILTHLMMNFYDELYAFIDQQYTIQLNGGISNIHSKLRELEMAYHESIKALNSKLSSKLDGTKPGQNTCMFYSEYVRMGKSAYDRSFEKETCMAVMANDKEQVYRSIGRFIEYLKKQELSHDDIVAYLTQYVTTMTITFEEMGLVIDDLYQESLSDIYKTIIQFYNLDKIRKYIKYTMIDPSMEALEQLQTSQSHKIMKDIERIVQETKGNITVTECAEQLGYHPTYLWKILKVEKNMSFSDYIENVKIEYAKRLLKETNMTVSDIAKEMNYTNAQNFIRFFNKITGTTPGKYRQELN